MYMFNCIIHMSVHSSCPLHNRYTLFEASVNRGSTVFSKTFNISEKFMQY